MSNFTDPPMRGIAATAEADIAAAPEAVWAALTDPDCVRDFMFGTTVKTDWQQRSPITWSGQYDGHSYQDKGKILAVHAPTLLVVTHFSPMSDAADVPENYQHLTYRLTPTTGGTRIRLTQDNNPDQGRRRPRLAELEIHARQSQAARRAIVRPR